MVFVPFWGIISTSVGTHVAPDKPIKATCFGRNLTDGFKLFEILANRDNQYTS